MKNILIMGIGRAGKTTLSEMIKNKYPNYNLVHSDSIKWALIRAAGKEEYYRTNIKEQKEFEHGEYFQKTLLEFFKSSIKDDTNKYGYILESGQLEPKFVKEMIDFNETIVICLGLGNLTKEEIIELCRKNDTQSDWTYNLPYADLEVHAEKWSRMNELLKVECPKYGIKYIDTSKNRKEVLDKILENIGEQL